MATSTAAAARARDTGYRVDDLHIDVGRQRLTRGDVEIPLPQLSFELFLALAQAAPNLVSFDQLMERVWAGRVVSPETVSQRVKLVRDALDDDPHSPHYIAGVRGRGYRMLAEVTALDIIPAALRRAASGPDASPADSPCDPLLCTTSASTTVAGSQLPAVPGAIASSASTAQSASSPVPGTGPADPPTPGPEPLTSRGAPASRRHGALVLAGLGLLTISIIAAGYGWNRIAPSAGRSVQSSVSAASVSAVSVIVSQPRTIAVLPLVDSSPGGGNQYLGDGLAQELSNRLARIPGVRVASQTSAAAFRGRPVDVRVIARSLGVRHVLEGSIRRDADHLRISAQLIDGGSGYRAWSQTYDQQWKDLLVIEDDVARSIIKVLQVVLANDAGNDSRQPSAAQLEAFNLYLSGIAKLQQSAGPVQLEAAEAAFQQALAIDSRFARGYAGLCESYALQYERDRDAALEARASAACSQALRLDGSLREVEVALARLYVVSGRNELASAAYRKLIAANPSDADAYIGLAESYAAQHRDAQAEAAYRHAIDVDPDYRDAETSFGNFLFAQGRSGEAVGHYRRVTKLFPSGATAFSNLGAALEMTGDLRGAAGAFDRSLELEPTRSAYSNSGTVYYFLGRFPDAVRMFRKAAELAGADHRVWGNLADALYQTASGRAEAQLEYRHAASLAERSLTVNPTDAVTCIQLGYYYARIRLADRARHYAQRAHELGPNIVYVHYYSALIAIQQRDSVAAIAALQRAMNLGYPAQLVRAAPEFATLRGDSRFERLVTQTAAPPAG